MQGGFAGSICSARKRWHSDLNLRQAELQVRERGKGNIRISVYHLIASRHVGAGEHVLPVGVLLLQVLPATLLYAAQAAHISFCWTFLLHIITAFTGGMSLQFVTTFSITAMHCYWSPTVTTAVDCCFIQQMLFHGTFDNLSCFGLQKMFLPACITCDSCMLAHHVMIIQSCMLSASASVRAKSFECTFCCSADKSYAWISSFLQVYIPPSPRPRVDLD